MSVTGTATPWVRASYTLDEGKGTFFLPYVHQLGQCVMPHLMQSTGYITSLFTLSLHLLGDIAFKDEF